MLLIALVLWPILLLCVIFGTVDFVRSRREDARLHAPVQLVARPRRSSLT